ncbi:MAG: enoyl-CoA hydratase/isomerase family protein [Candidatus Longimicrobiales bacterium M2_2A_002]
MADFNTIRIERDGRRATVIVDRPDKLNALNDETIDELYVAFHTLAEDDDIGGLVITGEGEKAFVAGADIAELATMGSIDGIDVSRKGQDAFRLLEEMGKPVVAAVNGYALGGGLELALACHLRVASEKAKFGLPEVKLGIIPGYGGTVRLPRIVGRGRALELILTGEMIGADRAYEMGLVNKVVAPEETRTAAEELLDTILKNGPIALRFALHAVDRSLETGIEEGLGLESHLFGLLASTDDMREGMSAFLEKRAAEFEGK